MADQPEVGIDLVVAYRLTGFRGLELRGEHEVAALPAHRLLDHFPGAAGARADIADVDPLALEVGDVADPRIVAGDDGDRLGVHREDCPQTFEGALLLELRGAPVGVVLPVGLHDTELELLGADGVDVVNGSAGRLGRAPDARLFAHLVDEAADCPAGRVVDAGHATGADRDELLRARSARRESDGQRRSHSKEVLSHVHVLIGFNTWQTEILTWPNGPS